MRAEIPIILLTLLLVSVIALWYWSPSIDEILWLFILVVWISVVVFWISKKVAEWQNLYVARKVIHILSGGLVAVLTPYLFKSPAIPLIGGVGMIVLTLLPRLRGEKFDWFQVEGNLGEVYFCITWTLVIVGLWYVDLSAGIAAALFMSVGDGVTGIVRNIVYKRWSKGTAGSVAMLLVSLPIGFFYKGYIGAIAAIVATMVERWPRVDDNLTVPIVSAVVMVLGDVHW
ncbi:MAG: hypothetical protein QI197_06310 [Candidatus Korarchaeota archaeon]|nr:hypothetical protein [Candidatus Korarchaeota archaeon]